MACTANLFSNYLEHRNPIGQFYLNCLYFYPRPKETQIEIRTSPEHTRENSTHEAQSDSDSIGEDDDTDDTFLPTGSNSYSRGGRFNGGSMERGGSVTGVGAIGLSPSKSPTQSVRSLLSRPRSTPQRRATISGSSPSLCRPYINISEVGKQYMVFSQHFPQSLFTPSCTIVYGKYDFYIFMFTDLELPFATYS